MLSAYLRESVWDCLLMLAVSASLCALCLDGFFVAASLQHGPLPVVASAVCLVLLCGVGYTSASALWGGIGYAAAVLVVWVACAVATPPDMLLVDCEENLLIFSVVVTLVPTLVFLLSRSRIGSYVLFAACVFTAGMVQFFYGNGELVWSLLATLASLAMVMYRNFLVSAQRATSVRSLSFVAGFATSLTVVLAALGVAVGVWYGVLAPLDPPVADVKFVTEYRALETRAVKGVADEYQTPNLDLMNSQVNDGERTTGDLLLVDNGARVPANGRKPPEEADENESGESVGMDATSADNAFDVLNYLLEHNIALYAVLLVLVAVLAFFVVRRLMRSWRLGRVRSLSPSEQVSSLYVFIVGKFGALGMGIARGQTSFEHARAVEGSVERFDAESGVRFADLAAVYAGVAYGNETASQEQADWFARYYKSFWKAARAQLGNWRYFLKSFSL